MHDESIFIEKKKGEGGGKAEKSSCKLRFRHDCEIDEGENIFFSGGELAVDWTQLEASRCGY